MSGELVVYQRYDAAIYIAIYVATWLPIVLSSYHIIATLLASILLAGW